MCILSDRKQRTRTLPSISQVSLHDLTAFHKYSFIKFSIFHCTKPIFRKQLLTLFEEFNEVTNYKSAIRVNEINSIQRIIPPLELKKQVFSFIGMSKRINKNNRRIACNYSMRTQIEGFEAESHAWFKSRFRVQTL